ncbi:MAG: BCCT family transporter [Gammaproteobacteria bacterium]
MNLPTKSLAQERFGLIVHPTVFFASVALIAFFVILTIVALGDMRIIYADIQSWIAENLGWLFILLVQGFLVFSVVLMLTRFGRVRLGGAGAKPAYSYAGWLSMLFSAGMGIGLVYWAVAEPVMHFSAPPFAEPGTAAAAKEAMQYTFLHWGLHAWGIYAVVAISLAYFAYNRGLPLTIRSAFHPLIGDRIFGWMGDVIDILAVLATMFGIATSLGLGVNQIGAGIGHVFGVESSTALEIFLIFAITLLATTSVVLGLDKGVKRLSEGNMILAAALMTFVLLLGPTLFILKSFVQNTGEYLQNLFQLASWTEAYRPDADWQAGWTVFYWAWWIAWSPFVGMFIARVSYGRTIRELILAVLAVPTLMTLLWMSVFSGAALSGALAGTSDIVAAVNENLSTSLFVLLEGFPLSSLTSGLAILLIIVFFVTSSDSGSLVIDTITSGGNTDPPVVQRVFWAGTEGVVAAALLLGGGLGALQTASITTGLPFSIVLALMCVGLLKALMHDYPAPPILGRRKLTST